MHLHRVAQQGTELEVEREGKREGIVWVGGSLRSHSLGSCMSRMSSICIRTSRALCRIASMFTHLALKRGVESGEECEVARAGAGERSDGDEADA